MKIEFSRQIFEKNNSADFMKIRPMKITLFFADKHDEANSYTSQFFQSAQQRIERVSDIWFLKFYDLKDLQKHNQNY
jgi:hypothetical protein